MAKAPQPILWWGYTWLISAVYSPVPAPLKCCLLT